MDMRRGFGFVLLLLLVQTAFGQTTQADYNRRYRWPFSVSAGFHPLSPLGSTRWGEFDVSEISAELRVPVGERGVLQPLLRGGVRSYTMNRDESTTGQDWSHQQQFAATGVGAASRMSREIEVGTAGWIGANQAVFSNLESEVLDSGNEYGQVNIEAGAEVSIAFNPSYNLSVAFKPSLRYTQSLGILDRFDGFSYGFGFAASYRFGRDPDASSAELRAIRFGAVEMPPVFAAMRSYYSQAPITTVEIANGENYDLEDVTIQFFQDGFMNSPTEIATFDRIEGGTVEVVPVLATFTEEVFTTEGITPLTGEIIATYTARGRSGEQRRSISYELHDRNALTWDDDRKVAAFITPADSAVRNYASYIRRIHRDVENAFVSPQLQLAIQAYNALAELGILYQVDPSSPFTSVQENTFAVDSVSFPRETLTRLTGDCDDLTVLFNTILQSAGVETAFVTTPGHIYSAVNTGVASRDYADVHSDREMLLEVDGEIWVLVEITLIGRAPFMEAWTTGIQEFRSYDSNPTVRGFYQTSAAHQTYRPVALRETDLGLQYGDADAIVTRFQNDLDALARAALAPLRTEAETRGDSRGWNRYGIAAAQFGAHGEAESAFERARELDAEHLSPVLNLGSLHFLRQQYEEALSVFSEAAESVRTASRVRSSERFKVYINLSRTHHSLQNYAEADRYFAQAREIDPEAVQEFSYIATTGGSSGEIGRASEVGRVEPILFFGED
jgi:tetratricopeptide (TPR) repeat protein